MQHTPAIRTSDTHPLRIDQVQPLGKWAAIGMSLCPGKHQLGGLTGHWARDLGKDLDRISDWGAKVVVSLIEDHEFPALSVATLPDEVARRGMGWRNLPIADRNPPRHGFIQRWSVLGKELVDRLKGGERVFIHCMGGLGRTGTIAACLLIESGCEPQAAIDMVRAARPGTIETALQEAYVLGYQPRFKLTGHGEAT